MEREMQLNIIPHYEVHELAYIFPAMRDDQFAELKASISRNGQRERIVLYDGKVLDGRHRARACAELGFAAEARTFDGGFAEARAFVIDANITRRHMTAGQRAMCAAAIANAKIGGDRPPDYGDCNQGYIGEITQSDAGDRCGVSRKSVNEAKAVVDYGVDELADAVRDGEVKLAHAVNAVKAERDPEEIRAALGAMERGEFEELPTALNAQARQADVGDVDTDSVATIRRHPH